MGDRRSIELDERDITDSGILLNTFYEKLKFNKEFGIAICLEESVIKSHTVFKLYKFQSPG